MANRRRRVWRRASDVGVEERELAGALFDSERTRARVMIGVFAVLCAASAVASIATALGATLFPAQAVPPPWLFGLLGLGFVGYEVLILVGLGVLRRKGYLVPEPPRYGNAFVEVSFVTLLLLVFAQGYDASFAFETPVAFVYVVPIILSTLRLSFALSLFTGAVAGLEYAALAAAFAHARPAVFANDAAFWYAASIGKGIVLTFAGALSGLVAREIRKRIDVSLALARERQRVVSTFGQYISPAVAERLLREEAAAAGTELRPVTVMFLDIRGFTRFSEKKSPEEVVAYLNRLFGFMIETVNRNNGLINKFLGDGFMAVFGAPFSDGRDGLHAADAAREIVSEVEARSARGDIPTTRVGIGIHSGLAVVGTIGSPERKEFTVIGDTVNLASRVEQLTKELDSRILVTEPVVRDLGEHHAAEELSPVRVRGREEPVRVYRLS